MSRLPSAGSPQPLMKSDGLPCHRRLGRPLVPGERLPVVDTAYGRPLPAEAGILEPKTAPRPHPSRGAGGPLRRAAGWVSCEPLVLLVEQDELLAHLARQALAAAGFSRLRSGRLEDDGAPYGGPHLVVVDLAAPGACRRLPPRPLRDRPVTAGYLAGRPLSLLAHAAHGCVDLLLELSLVAGRPRLEPVEAAAGHDLTRREADVLALLLAGSSDRGIASELTVSPATVRSHARSLLRRLEAADRAELRRRDRRL